MSYITMSAAEVKKLANGCLESIAKEKDRRWQEEVNLLRAKYIESWSHRFLNEPIPSDEFLMKEVHAGRGIDSSESTFIELYGRISSNVAHKLLNTTLYSDVIYVSADDLERIT